MTMYVPSQASLFDDLMSAPLTSSLAAHLVSRSAWPASKKARKTSATSGLISHASSKRSDPVGYWLRTYLAFELSRLTSSSKTWKNSGTPHGRSWWVLTTLEPRTVARGCGLWPTATAGDAGMSGSAGTTLTDAASGLWARPQARDWKDSGPTQGNRKSPNLGTQAHAWPTPKATDWKDGRRGNDPRHGRQLGQEASIAGLLDQEIRSTNGKRHDWPTPTAHDGGRPGGDLRSTQGGNLSRDAAMWTTPQAHDGHGLADPARHGRFGTKHGGRNLPDHAAAVEWPTPRANRHGAPDSHGKSPIRGALNPAWVTQLMGFPDGWLDAEPPTAAKR